MVIIEPAALPVSANSGGMTADEFMEFRADEGHFELIRGEVVQLAPPGYDHGFIAVNAVFLLKGFVKAKGLGQVFVETGFILEENPSTVRSPDVSFLRKERLPTGGRLRKFYPGAPDLAVEVLSPSDPLKEAEDKIEMYFRAGTTLAWILDPEDSTVRIYRPGEASRRLGPEGEIDAEPLLPGFRCKISELFE